MAIEITIPPVFQALVNGTTVGECVQEMVKQYPALKPKIFEKRNHLTKGMSIFLNGVSAYPEPLAKTVHDGDKIYLTHIILGG